MHSGHVVERRQLARQDGIALSTAKYLSTESSFIHRKNRAMTKANKSVKATGIHDITTKTPEASGISVWNSKYLESIQRKECFANPNDYINKIYLQY